jgi:hypothetical protein
MLDALPSEPGKDHEAARRHLDGRLILGAVAALLIMAAAFGWRVANGPAPTAAPVTNVAQPAKNPVLEELVEATKALQISQQQAIDQLQILQEQLADQQSETRKSSGEVAGLSDKLENLRHSFASVAVPAEEADTLQRAKAKPAVVHARRKPHRFASRRTHAAATRR